MECEFLVVRISQIGQKNASWLLRGAEYFLEARTTVLSGLSTYTESLTFRSGYRRALLSLENRQVSPGGFPIS